MGAIFCCLRDHDGHENHASNNTCSVGCCCPKCFVRDFINMSKNVAPGQVPGQETISASSNIQDVAAANFEVVENSSSNESRLGNGEQSEDERSILLPPQHVNVAPTQETISTLSNIQDGAASNSDVVENYSSNESRLELDSVKHSEDKRSQLLGRQHTNLTPRQATLTSSSANQEDASSSSEVVHNCSSHGSRLDSNVHPEDETCVLLVNLEAAIRNNFPDEIRSSGPKVDLDPVLQSLDQRNSESMQKDRTFTPCGSSTVKKVSQEVESGFMYTFPLPRDECDEDVCPTCFEDYDEENPKITAKCNHHFHLGCIYEWMERSETCPFCREIMLFDE